MPTNLLFRRSSLYARALLTASFIALVVACGGDSTSGTTPGGGGGTVDAVTTVTVSPSSANVVVGATTTLTAATLSSTGAALTGRTVAWSSSNTAVATVNAGVVVGVGAGTATISAVSEGKTGSATITVPPQVVTTLAFVNAPTTGTVGVTTTLVVQAKDANGNVIANEPVVWSTSNGRVATTAANGAFTTCATVEGATCAFTGTKLVRYGKDAAFFNMFATGGIVCSSTIFGGDPLPNVAKACSTAELLQTTGSLPLRPVGAGTVIVTARSVNNSGVIAVTSLTVSGGVISKYGLNTTLCATCTVSGVTLTAGTQAFPTIYPTDDADNILNVPVNIASNNTVVATAAVFTGPSYVINALANGTATVTFSPGTGITGASNQFLVSVGATAAAVSTVTLATNASTIGVGQSTQLTATLKDASNNTLTGRAITYTSSTPTVATVSATGLVSGVAAGTTTLTATSEGKSGTVNVTVTAAAPVAVATVTTTAASNALTVPQTTQLTVVTKDAGGNTLTGRTITYASGTPAVATVSATGLVTAVAAGTATITATSEGINGSTVITVTAAAAPVRLGFAMINGATNAVDPNYSFNGGGGAITVTSTATGKWHVVFAGLGRTAGQSDFARVTPQKDVMCTFENYGQDANVANAFIDVVCQGISPFTLTNNASFSVMFVGNGIFTGRTGFLRADNATAASYTLDANFAYNSNSATMSVARTTTGAYQNVSGLFPRGTATPEVPLIGTFYDASFATICESEGVELAGTRSFIECRSGNTFGAMVDGRYNQLIFSGGRTGTAWGFGYYYSRAGAFDITPFQRTSDGTAVTFPASATGGRLATLSSLGGTAALNIQIMPNFNGGSVDRWTTCGYGAIDRTAKTVEVVCRDRNNAIVASDFVVVTFQ